MSFLPVALLAVGTGLQMMSSIREGQAASAAAKANANLMQMQAGATEQAGAYEAEKLKREKAQMMSRQRALYAKSGVSLEEGSPLEVMADTATQYEMDLSALRYNTAIQAQQQRYQSAIYQSAAKSAGQLSILKAGSTLLTGAYGVSQAMPIGATTAQTSMGTVRIAPANYYRSSAARI